MQQSGKTYQNYFEWLGKNNIPVDGIRIIPEEFTAGAYITTDMADNQITGFNPGAMKYASGWGLESAVSENAITLIAPGNLDDMISYARDMQGKRYFVYLRPGTVSLKMGRQDSH